MLESKSLQKQKNKTTNLVFRIEPELLEALTILAQADGISVGDEARSAMKRGLVNSRAATILGIERLAQVLKIPREVLQKLLEESGGVIKIGN